MPRGLKIIVKIDKRDFPKELNKVIAGVAGNDLLVPKLGEYDKSDEFRAMLVKFNSN